LWSLWPLYLGLFALGLGLDVLFLPRRGAIGCRIEMPSTISIGETAEAFLTVVVPSSRPVAVTVAVDLSDLLLPQAPLRGLASRAGGRLVLPLVPTRRGRVVVEHAWVRVAGPLGLLAAVVRLPLGARAVVVPDVRPVHRTALRFATDRELRAGLKIERYAGDGSEIEALRDHTPGDDPRAIDWKSSARHRRLIARQHRAERNHQVVLAVDGGRLLGEPVAGVPKLDHALTAALLLAYVSLRAGDRVGLYSFAGAPGIWLEPRSGPAAFPALQRAAGEVPYAEAETSFTLGLATLAGRLRRRSLVVVLSDFVDATGAALLVESLSRLASRHAVVFVALSDPALAAAAEERPDGMLGLHRAVVAADLLREREVVLGELRLRGIRPIDAPPSRVSPELLNAYLEIKRREKIG
jgi:uncharacterized protein (DUF58 family)